MVTKDLRHAWRFFFGNAGYSTPPGRAVCALQLARAEELFLRAVDEEVATVEWVDDDVPYDQDAVSDEEAARLFESNEWTGPYGCVLRVNGDVAASLCGIVVGPRGTNDPYCRVVEAELADEASAELRAALGDTEDGAGLA